MRIFNVDKRWGSFVCQHVENDIQCENETFTILLTDEENSQLPEKSGTEAEIFIIQNRLGKALCNEHLPKT